MKFQTIQSALTDCFHEKYRNRIAIEHQERQVTYNQLAIASSVLAGKLSAAGAMKGMHIGVLSDDRSIIIAAAVAIFKLGCVFVPLDPSFPVSRLRALGKTADLRYIVLDDALSAELKEQWLDDSVESLQINKSVFFRAGTATDFDAQVYNENDPIYIYFTTGTTGQPKPVVGKNIALMHFIGWEIKAFEFTAGIRISQLTSPCHDPYLRDVFTTLTVGGTICIPDNKHTILSPFEFKNWVNKAEVNVIHCTPTMFRNLCSGGLTETDFPALKWILLAGERLLAKDLSRWYDTFGERIHLVNLYGPTETTLAKLSYRISPGDLERTFIPIGKPIHDTSVHILNSTMQECAGGEPGELYINTPYRTLGYYKNDSLNNELFIPDPFSGKPENILYKTGDFVRLLPDQNIQFIERKDRQVKIRGKQVELGEIENELLGYPAMHSCIVGLFNRDTGTDPEYLAAYYIAPEVFSKDELTSYLKEKLPDYMLPQHYIRMHSFPMNVNGKVDISSLPDPKNGSVVNEIISATNGAGSSNNEIGDKLMFIWKEILNKDEIGTQDAFMTAGGDSLGIMQLIARVHTEFEFELSLWQIFDDLTIDKLTTLIKENYILIK